MARLGGIGIPLPLQMAATGDSPIHLPPGGIYKLPAGNWMWQAGQQIVMQWFDPNQQQWRGIGYPGAMFDWISSDGGNFRLINYSGVVAGAQINAAGTGAINGIGPTATGVNVTFAAPATAATGNTATAYAIVGGAVAAPSVLQGGSGFAMVPLVFIDPPSPGGIQATAVATISAAGVVTGITMTNAGAGYTAAPNFYLVPCAPGSYNIQGIPGVVADVYPIPGFIYPTNTPQLPVYQPNQSGTGAQLGPATLTGSGTVTGIVMTNNGGGYDGTHIPAVTITGAGAATATAIMSMCVTSVTLGAGGAAYTTAPIWESSLGVVVPGQINNQMPNPQAARGVCVAGAGAVTSFVVESPGFGLQKVPVISVINAGSIATTIATGTAVCGGQNDWALLQGKVQ
jgi:hypothetical protein